MTLNPPSNRFPFDLTGVHPEVARAIRWAFNGLTNHEQAFAQLGKQTSTSGTGTTTTLASETFNTETIVEASTIIGYVNDQTGVTSYTTLPSDYGKEIEFNDASPIAVTLSTLSSNPAIQLPWFAYVNNVGTGTVTLTPASGTINGGTSVSLATGEWAMVFFDGTDFIALIYVPGSGSGVSSLNSLTGALDLTSTGSSISITPSGTNIDLEGYSLGGTLTSANVAFGPGAGTGPSLDSISGLDGSHFILFTTGTSPVAGTILTVTLTASRGHTAYPVITPTGSSPISLTSTLITVNGGSTTYSIEAE
jgi:hypothetical protein